jgi:hypothetical protein
MRQVRIIKSLYLGTNELNFQGGGEICVLMDVLVHKNIMKKEAETSEVLI